MRYLIERSGEGFVVQIANDFGTVVDTSEVVERKYDAMGLRDVARNEGVAKFAHIGMAKSEIVAEAADEAVVTPTNPEVEVPAAPDLDVMTVAELVDFADSEGIEIKRSARKADIKKAIMKALKS